MSNIIPTELKDFHKIFEKSCQMQDSGVVFIDFLEFIISGFCYEIPFKPSGKYSSNQFFMDLLGEVAKVMERVLKSRLWYDPFGTYYEAYLITTSKTKHFAQFFTPDHIVDLMCAITLGSEASETGNKVNDPCCGSGRMLLSYHTNNLGNFVFGEDLDRVCCLMAVCNMLLHGAVGQIVHRNSLERGSFFEGWSINTDLNRTGIPSIKVLHKADAMCIKSENIELSIPEKKVRPMEQLSLF